MGGYGVVVATWRTTLLDTVAGRLERLEQLDAFSQPAQDAVRAAIPNGSVVKDVAVGSWFGHPVHPALTDVVVGSWLGGFALDLLGGAKREQAADDLVALGVLAAVPTAVTGLADWADVGENERRVGTVHALANVAALALQVASWRARHRSNRAAGVGLTAGAIALSTAAAWLGGHLSFGRGVGVDETAFEAPPTTWTVVNDDDKLEKGELVRRSARGTGVVLVRYRGRVHALLDRCNHRGCSLSEGEFDGTAITCPCHGSRFALDGSLLRGPAAYPQPVLETRVHEGKIEVRARWAG